MESRRRFLTIGLFLFTLALGPVGTYYATPRAGVNSVSELWLDVSLGPPLVGWFNRVARPEDIARVESVEQIGLLAEIRTGRRLVVFKSAAEAERRLPLVATDIDIVGYNLEHSPATPAEEQADPVGSVQRMQALARRYDLALALGPDHDFALDNGPAMASYVDLFILQVQRSQQDPQAVRAFVLPLVAQLRQANPAVAVSVQVRTEGDVVALVDLIDSLKGDLDGVSILTSPTTTETAEALVNELRSRNATPPAATATPPPAAPAVTVVETLPPNFWPLWAMSVVAALLVGAILGGLLTLLLQAAQRRR
ncbi:MAG: hypothetical protein L0332_19980 [Chloroflexi bacterium]|nr:hypothetical protein [Chloroflexota bacterium]MCI0579829.1 hypothetical protein [Chloroflexota bacterium]MCI0646755.1 hypothetical protein [Chloroflexota bacterium]MCI0728978.1 hypothetical protein [Chloroflexota bacterium]